MHDDMPYGPIQSQGQGDVVLEVRNTSIFKISSVIFSGSWKMIADY